MSAAPAPHISIVIPAYDEAPSIGRILDEIAALRLDAEVIVVDDGSQDDTVEIARARAGVQVIEHAYNVGNGAAVKTGIRAARGSAIVLMDGDGQHRPADILRLVACLGRYDMVVGARTAASEAELHRNLANSLYNAIASYLVGRPIPDLTSGFRAVRASIAKRFVYLLPNGFSYPTTITLALFRAGHTVRYEPIVASARQGKSKIRLIRDGLGFLLTLLRIGTLFVPLRIFLPVATALFIVGVGYGTYLLIFWHRFSNMAVLLILSGIMLFMLGLISEQIALLRMAQVGLSHDDL
jgi:glycosyltransferase involved in cell wall biosynthesis